MTKLNERIKAIISISMLHISPSWTIWSVLEVFFAVAQGFVESAAFSDAAGVQWQFWQRGWHRTPLTRHLQPPDVSPAPWGTKTRPRLAIWCLWITELMISVVLRLTWGPHRACLVTQQISVLHIKQQIQSQPSFFWTITWHLGQFIASPFFRSCWKGNQSIGNRYCNVDPSTWIENKAQPVKSDS